MIDLSIFELVAAGVVWLDANVPGWVDQIDLERLDLAECRECVLGQLFGDYYDVDAEIDKFELGFNLYADYPATMGDLTAEWRRVISERRAQAAGASS